MHALTPNRTKVMKKRFNKLINKYYEFNIVLLSARTTGNVSHSFEKIWTKLEQSMFHSATIEDYFKYDSVALLKLFSRCDKGAYEDEYKRVAGFFSLASKSKLVQLRNLHINTKPLFIYRLGFAMSQIPIPATHQWQRFLRIAHSGLVNIWDRWETLFGLDMETRRSLRVYKRDQEKVYEPKSLSLSDNIITVFIAWFIIISAAVVTIVIECTIDKMHLLRSTIRYVRMVVYVAFMELGSIAQKLRPFSDSVPITKVQKVG